MSNADRNDYIVAMAEAKREYERYLLASKRSRPNTRVDSRRATPEPAVETVAALEAIVPDSMLQEIVNEAIAPEERAGLVLDAAAPSHSPRKARKKAD